MRVINSPYLCLLALMAFFWLGYVSRHQEAAYTVSEFSVLKGHPRLKGAQAKVIMDLWHISDEEITQPVRIFGE